MIINSGGVGPKGPGRETPPPAIILNEFRLDLFKCNILLNTHTYKHRAYSLQFGFIKFVKSDIWGWGPSA